MKKLTLYLIIFILLLLCFEDISINAEMIQSSNDPYFYFEDLETRFIASGIGNFVVITTIGRVFAWGYNNYGKLGDGSTTDRNIPIEITNQFGLENDEKIETLYLGDYHSSAITSNGRVFFWGLNKYGQLGDGTTIDRYTPIEITHQFNLKSGEKVISLSLGSYHSSVVTSNGRVFTWGFNVNGQLGDGSTTNKSIPTEITNSFIIYSGDKVVSLYLGSNYSSAITLYNRVFTWGNNDNGRLGDGTTTERYVPMEITNQFDIGYDAKVVSIVLGESHSSAITSNERIFTWGNNDNGKLGDGTTTDRYIPTDITNQFNLENDEKVVNLSLGTVHSSAITSNKRVFTWGLNSVGQLGDGSKNDRYEPTEITHQFNLKIGEKITNLSLGYFESSAITSKGRIFTWGSSQLVPIEMNIFSIKIKRIYLPISESTLKLCSGSLYSSLVTTEGRVFSWGLNNYGQIGDGTTTDRYVPTEITNNFNLQAGEKVVNLAIGREHSSAITSNGRVFSWGRNNYGQLGDGTTTDRYVPTEITHLFNLEGSEKVVSIYLGNSFSSAITSNGRVFTWGSNNNGQIGDGTTTDRYVPTEITHQFNLESDEKVISLGLGNNHSSAITSNGRLFTWGENSFGQLGNGSTTATNVPTEITHQFNLQTGDKIVSISLGYLHSSAITSNGRLFTWGANYSGQLGDKTLTNRHVPKEITYNFDLRSGDKIASVVLGGYHSSAITSNGRIFTWGSNGSGQLGNGTTTNKSIPIEITYNIGIRDNDQVLSLSLGLNHSSAIISSGRISTWGNNTYVDLGMQSPTHQYYPFPLNKTVNNIEKILLTYAESYQNYLSENCKLSIFPEYDYTEEIVMVEINNIQYDRSKFTSQNGRIDINVLSSNIFGETLNYTINSITLKNGIVIIPNGNLSTSITLVEDTFEPRILFDYEYELYIEENIGNDTFIGATAIDDTGEVVEVNISGRVDWNKVGIYELTYSTIDKAGNEAIRTRLINVMPNICFNETEYYDMTFYYFDDEMLSSNSNLLNQRIKYNSEYYLSNTLIDQTKLVLGSNILLYEFEIGNRLIILTKNLTVPLIGIIPNNIYHNTAQVYFNGTAICKINDGEYVQIESGKVFTSIGEYQIVVTLDDQSESEFLFTIVDTIDPTFDEIVDQTIEAGSLAVDWTTLIINEQDNSNGLLTKVVLEDNVIYDKVDKYLVTVKLLDESGNATSQKFYVNIIDTTAPTFDEIVNQTIEAGSLAVDWTTLIINNQDNSDGLLTKVVIEDSVVYDKVGKYLVTVKLLDESGNFSSQNFYVNVVDTTAPLVYLKPTLSTIYVHDVFIDSGVEVIDISETFVEVIGEVKNYEPGIYRLTYIVEDIYGNRTQIERVVHVVNQPLEVIFELEDSITTLKVGENYQDPGCKVTINGITNYCMVVENNVDVNRSGIYVIIYSFTFRDIEYTYKRYIFIYNELSNNLIQYYRKEEEGGI